MSMMGDGLITQYRTPFGTIDVPGDGQGFHALCLSCNAPIYPNADNYVYTICEKCPPCPVCGSIRRISDMPNSDPVTGERTPLVWRCDACEQRAKEEVARQQKAALVALIPTGRPTRAEIADAIRHASDGFMQEHWEYCERPSSCDCEEKNTRLDKIADMFLAGDFD